MRSACVAVLCSLTGFIALAPPTSAQEVVSVELNKLEQLDDRCRVYVVLENGTDLDFGTLTLDLVVFDTDGLIARRLAFEGAPLPAQKLRAKLFDLTGMPCDSLARVLLNDVVGCASIDGDDIDCSGMIATSSRSGVQFLD